MKLHLIGGFLGSGKTTAITNASLLLKNKGILAGVITNDQGNYLVDSSFC
jgi:G3E family GTPase